MRLALLLLLTVTSTASAVVIRHDVEDAKYRMSEEEFPALVDLPHEGHGVLIAPQWVVTAAHATQWHPVSEVMLNGKCRKVERLIVHTGYKALPSELQSGEAGPAMAFLATSDDIALIKLAEPVTDVLPVPLYRGNDEFGTRIQLLGKGGTGNGVTGQAPHSPNRTALRRAFNTISGSEDRWLSYVFDSGSAGLQLEGISANGDSGGPVLLNAGGVWQLAGLASWKYQEDGATAADFRSGIYGQTSKNVRISHYIEWIESFVGPGLDAKKHPANTGNGG